ncbi:LysR family transcriptional regulator [Parasedimentitalea marina]|uniref:LysR family transcriptional regulator n=2 Tax=Parasedimentitalea marina TaxID=2483033 RepID=A0A3T0N342_9RHOB|nr:LysR family transcriptional regulator [Parasedimentitalea marina]AZV78440.1 LysR family transcriptional regulator [Parasedimentitalea marina]
MDRRIEDLDWTYIRSFLAVAEEGSLTAAARATGQSQPTLGRHIKAAEASLGTELFVRASNGLKLTKTGLTLLEPARDMAKASARLTTLAAGSDTQLSGTVRITASVVVSHYLLPEIIAEIRLAEPDIEIELVPSDTTESLMYRDADIAIRMYRPTQLDIVTRKIAEQPLAIYASHELLGRLGQPQNFEDLAAMPFVGFDRSDMIIRSMREIGLMVDRHFFGVRCDDQATYWELVRAGCGAGAMQTVIGDAEPLVQKLAYQPELPCLPIWLAAQENLYRTPKVKCVWNYLTNRLIRKLG